MLLPTWLYYYRFKSVLLVNQDLQIDRSQNEQICIIFTQTEVVGCGSDVQLQVGENLNCNLVDNC